MDMFKKHGISPSVSGFPTILYFHPNKITNPESYNGDRSYEDLKKWILDKKGKGKGSKPVVILTNYNPNNNRGMGMGMGMGKGKGKGMVISHGLGKQRGLAFSQSGGGGGGTRRRRHMKRKSHTRRKSLRRRHRR
jgi:hypothetical protein